MSELLSFAAETLSAPVGARPGADTRVLAQGVLLGYDALKRLASVAVSGSGVSVLPVLDGISWSSYIDAPVWVLRDGTNGRALGVIAPVGAAAISESEPSTSTWPPITGTITALNASSGHTVSTSAGTFVASAITTTAAWAVSDVALLYWPNEVSPWLIGKVLVTAAPGVPAAPLSPGLSRSGSVVTASWTRGTSQPATDVRYRIGGGAYRYLRTNLLTARLPIEQGQTLGVSVRAVNAAGASNWSTESTITYAAYVPPAAEIATRTIVIAPSYSGTYEAGKGWGYRQSSGLLGVVDAYNLWQGTLEASGVLTGFAGYGEQIASLRALSITAMTLTLVEANTNTEAVTIRATVEGAKPTGLPTFSGSSFTSTPAALNATTVENVPSALWESFRTGALKGFGFVGSTYAARRGKSYASGMALTITYTVNT